MYKCVVGLFVQFRELAWSTMGELDNAVSSSSAYGVILLNSNIGITPTYLVLNYSALECGASAVSIVLDRSRDELQIEKKRDRERQLQASAL